jgi:hypothetical protein
MGERKRKEAKVTTILRQPSPVRIMLEQTEPQNVEHFKYLGCMIKNDARITREIKCCIAMTKAAFNMKKAISIRKLDY